MNWGPEKMLIRCSKESQHPAEWTPGLRLSIRRTRKTQRDGHMFGSKYFSSVRSPAPSHTQTLSNPFRTLAIKWEVNILLKKSYCIFIIVSVYLLCRYDAVDDNITHLVCIKLICNDLQAYLYLLCRYDAVDDNITHLVCIKLICNDLQAYLYLLCHYDAVDDNITHLVCIKLICNDLQAYLYLLCRYDAVDDNITHLVCIKLICNDLQAYLANHYTIQNTQDQ